jgi:hypothetical protein
MQTRQQLLGTQGQLTLRCRLPTCILPGYWQRHALSRKDIDTIVSYIPTRLLWMSAVLSGASCPWYSLRSSSASPMEVTLSGKAVAVDLILGAARVAPSLVHKLDVDSVESFEHVPPLPRYRIPEAEVAYISRGISSQLVPRVLLGAAEPVGSIPLIYPHLGQSWVPIGIEGASICCNAVVLEQDYVHMAGPQRGFTHAPQVGIHNGQAYCLTDELVLFCANSS